jgi:hypothetical protein
MVIGHRPSNWVLFQFIIAHHLGMLELLSLLLRSLGAAVGSRADLVTENLLLRHQLAVLTRPGRKRPPLRAGDKLVWVLACQLCRAWRRHLVLVRPDTVVRWHRRAWTLCWRWKSRDPLGRPRLSAKVRELIATMARESALGHRAHPRRAAEAGHRRQQPLDPPLSPAGTRPPAESELADLPGQSSAGHLGGRFLRGPDAHVQDAARAAVDRPRPAGARPRQRHR